LAHPVIPIQIYLPVICSCQVSCACIHKAPSTSGCTNEVLSIPSMSRYAPVWSQTEPLSQVRRKVLVHRICPNTGLYWCRILQQQTVSVIGFHVFIGTDESHKVSRKHYISRVKQTSNKSISANHCRRRLQLHAVLTGKFDILNYLDLVRLCDRRTEWAVATAPSNDVRQEELRCCWDGRAMLYKSNSEKMGWVSFREKNLRKTHVRGDDS